MVWTNSARRHRVWVIEEIWQLIGRPQSGVLSRLGFASQSSRVNRLVQRLRNAVLLPELLAQNGQLSCIWQQDQPCCRAPGSGNHHRTCRYIGRLAQLLRVPGNVFCGAHTALAVRAIQHRQKAPFLFCVTCAVINFPAIFKRQPLPEPIRKARANRCFTGFNICSGGCRAS